jgi:hypothetical protein
VEEDEKDEKEGEEYDSDDVLMMSWLYQPITKKPRVPTERERLNERCIEIRTNEMGRYRSLGMVPAFKELQEEANGLGLHLCSSLVCVCPAKSTDEFYENSKTSSGLQSNCKECDKHPDAIRDAKEKQAFAANGVIDAIGSKKSNGVVEDEAMNNYLLPTLREGGFVAASTPELRHDDGAARRPDWPQVGKFLGFQLKANGIYKDGGKTLQPNDSINRWNGGGAASFNHCLGYEGSIFIAVKMRKTTKTSPVTYTVWMAKGDDIPKDQLAENVDETLGPTNIEPIKDKSELCAFFDKMHDDDLLPLSTWEEMLMNVKHVKQRKEMIFMMANRVLGKVEFPFGNQTDVDMRFDGESEQAKSSDFTNGQTHTDHIHNGVNSQPYDNELIQFLRMRFGGIVKSGDKFYLMHTTVSKAKLLEHGVLKHNGANGLRPSAGKTAVSMPDGIFGMWLNGRERKSLAPSKWLATPEHCWRPPVELIPGDPVHRLSRELLQEVAHVAACPDLFPSDQELKKWAEYIAGGSL